MKNKVSSVCDLLDACHGFKRWPGREPVLDELIRTVLSQNTSVGNCSKAFEELIGRFGTWEAVRSASWRDIASSIRVGGLANRKAPRIRAILETIRERQGDLDLEWLADQPDRSALSYLLGFDGVGRKTAACVLMFALGRPVLPVDTHVHRVSTRLGLIPRASPDTAHDLLGRIVPTERVYSFHLNMVQHGRRICHARSPRCPDCCLRGECDYSHGKSRTRSGGQPRSRLSRAG